MGYGDQIIKYRSTKVFLIIYILVSSIIVVYMLNTMHSIQKSYYEVKKRKKALQQKKSFEESWHELQKMIASMSDHHIMTSQQSHVPVGGPNPHSLPISGVSIDHHQQNLRQHLFSSDHTFTRNPTHMSIDQASEDPYYFYGNRNFSTDSTVTTAANITCINEFQFVIFILRHLQIIDEKKHIQPWIKVDLVCSKLN